MISCGVDEDEREASQSSNWLRYMVRERSWWALPQAQICSRVCFCSVLMCWSWLFSVWEMGNRGSLCPHHCLKLSNQQPFSHVAVLVSKVKNAPGTVGLLAGRSLVHKLLLLLESPACLAGCLKTGTNVMASSCLTHVLSPQPNHQHSSSVGELPTILRVGNWNTKALSLGLHREIYKKAGNITL